MSKIILTTVFLLFATGLFSQIKEGVIRYEYTVDLHRNIPAERADIRNILPQHRTQHFELFFNEGESLYKPSENGDDQGGSRGGGGMRMMMRNPRTETYIDRKQREVTILQEYMGRNFLITDTLDLAQWRVGDERMDIEGYICMMAWHTDTVTEQEITAWFTPQIQPFLGPDRFVNLPGTVLAVDINNGEQVWVAREIIQKEIRNGDIRKPSRGEKISREDFRKMIQEQMERMGGTGMRRF